MSKYLETKSGSIEQAVLEALNGVSLSETNKNDKSDDGEGLDAVQPKAVKKKFDDRKDKDIDNDGDTDSSDEFLHKKRKAISKAISKKEGNAFTGALNAAKEKGDTTFVVAGKKYKVEDHQTESAELDEAVKISHVLVDTANGDKVVSMASSEEQVKQSKHSAERPPMSVKDKNTLKVVALKKPLSQKAADKLMGQSLKESAELDEALAKSGQYEVISGGKDGVASVKFKGKVIATGDFDSGADGWMMNIKGEKGQKFFDSAQKIADYFAKNKITEESNISRYVAEIAKQWGEAAEKEDEKKKVMCEDCGKVHEGACAEEKDGTTMTGKPMDKVEVSVKEKD